MFSFRRHTDKRNGLNIDTREITLEPADNARLLSLCGQLSEEGAWAACVPAGVYVKLAPLSEAEAAS